MKLAVAALATGMVLLAAPAHSAVTFQYLAPGGYPTAISNNGSVVAGNTAGAYEPYRWTLATGLVNLGHGSLPVIGRTAGAPGMSADGTRIASTIISDDSTVVSMGLWTLGQGWQQLVPPLPPGGGSVDEELGSVWGMSGDGNTVVGLFWRPGGVGGSAHAFRWTQATGMVDLGSSGRSSKGADASFNGSVIAGWDESPQYGYRRAAAWRNGQLTVLHPDSIPGEAGCVSDNGLWVAGRVTNPALYPTNYFVDAARWHWDGSAWTPTQFLGHVDGNSGFGQGKTVPNGITSDGKFIVGYNTFDGDPFYTTGFLWTDSTGCVDIEFWLQDQGVDLDPLFDIQGLTACSPDGQYIVGYGQDILAPYTLRGFMIHTDRALVGVDPTPAPAPARIALAASPNPARRGTSFSFTLGTAGRARLGIYDATGRLVRQVLDGERAAGAHHVAWDGRDADGQSVRAGVYFTRLESAAGNASGKLVVVD
jgi:probable HAF family extracellular repeat protein